MAFPCVPLHFNYYLCVRKNDGHEKGQRASNDVAGTHGLF